MIFWKRQKSSDKNQVSSSQVLDIGKGTGYKGAQGYKSVKAHRTIQEKGQNKKC